MLVCPYQDLGGSGILLASRLAAVPTFTRMAAVLVMVWDVNKLGSSPFVVIGPSFTCSIFSVWVISRKQMTGLHDLVNIRLGTETQTGMPWSMVHVAQVGMAVPIHSLAQTHCTVPVRPISGPFGNWVLVFVWCLSSLCQHVQMVWHFGCLFLLARPLLLAASDQPQSVSVVCQCRSQTPGLNTSFIVFESHSDTNVNVSASCLAAINKEVLSHWSAQVMVSLLHSPSTQMLVMKCAWNHIQCFGCDIWRHMKGIVLVALV